MNDRTLNSKSQHLEWPERHRRLPPALRHGVWIACIIAVSAGCATPVKHYYSDRSLDQINVGADRPHILAMFEGMEIHSKQRDPAGNLLEVGEVTLVNDASERKSYWFLFKNGRLVRWGPREDPATDLTKVAPPDRVRGENTEAEAHDRRALPFRKQALGSEEPTAAQSLTDLAFFFRTQRRYDLAESLFEWALSVREKTLGPDHLDVATSLENYADLLRQTHRKAEATVMEARAKAIRVKYAQENPVK